MFDIGGPELVFLLLLALIVFGPQRLPELARQLGTQTAKFREAWHEFRRTLEREAALSDLQKAGRDVRDAAERARTTAGALARGELDADGAPGRRAHPSAGASVEKAESAPASERSRDRRKAASPADEAEEEPR